MCGGGDLEWKKQEEGEATSSCSSCSLDGKQAQAGGGGMGGRVGEREPPSWSQRDPSLLTCSSSPYVLSPPHGLLLFPTMLVV